MRTSAAAVVLTLLFSLPASAQTLFQGRIDVTVQDAQGGRFNEADVARMNGSIRTQRPA